VRVAGDGRIGRGAGKGQKRRLYHKAKAAGKESRQKIILVKQRGRSRTLTIPRESSSQKERKNRTAVVMHRRDQSSRGRKLQSDRGEGKGGRTKALRGRSRRRKYDIHKTTLAPGDGPVRGGRAGLKDVRCAWRTWRGMGGRAKSLRAIEGNGTSAGVSSQSGQWS